MSEEDFLECVNYFSNSVVKGDILSRLGEIVDILNNNKKVKYFWVNSDNELLYFDEDVQILPSDCLSINRDKFTSIQRNKKIDEILGC
jgi:hypothetical protein